jgi:hypothetical protein
MVRVAARQEKDGMIDTRAVDAKHGPPVTLANMRKEGVHAVVAISQNVDVDALSEAFVVLDTGRRLRRCSQCRGKRIDTRPTRHVMQPDGRGHSGRESASDSSGSIAATAATGRRRIVIMTTCGPGAYWVVVRASFRGAVKWPTAPIAPPLASIPFGRPHPEGRGDIRTCGESALLGRAFALARSRDGTSRP